MCLGIAKRRISTNLQAPKPLEGTSFEAGKVLATSKNGTL